MKIYQKQKEDDLTNVDLESGNMTNYVQDDMESTELLYARKKGKLEPIPSSSYGGGVNSHPLSDPTIGVALLKHGGGSGSWTWIDKNSRIVYPSAEYFKYHPIYSNITEVNIDSEIMIRIPKFYYKNVDHKNIYISSMKVDDTYKVHPAFMVDGVEKDCFWIGKYTANNIGGNIPGSRPDVMPWTSINFTNAKAYCSNKGTVNECTFQLPNIYMLSAIQTLFLVEYATTDSQSSCGRGHVQGSSAETTTGVHNITANYRGIIGLWGNVWEWLDGIDCSSYKIRVWDNNGNKTWQKTNVPVAAYGSGWVSGDNCGYIQTVSTEVGENYDLTDVYIASSLCADQNYSEASYSDYFFGSNGGNTVCLCGARWDDGFWAGVFTLDFRAAAAASDPSIGFRLSGI